jgi:Phosphotransferase enzyme family
MHEMLVAPTVVSDRSWGHGRSLVLEVRDAEGARWFVKQHREAHRYQSELSAYRRWTSGLGDRAPILHASDDELQVIVLSALAEDRHADWRDPAVQRDAGESLRRLHDGEEIDRWDDLAADKRAQFDQWTAQARGWLSSGELDFVRSELKVLERLPAPMRVPCHLDYTPRNWLIADGRVAVIDFEEAAPEVWVNDLGHLYFRWWRDPRAPRRPPGAALELQQAFLEGYSRQLTEDGVCLLRASYGLSLVRYLTLARKAAQADHEASLRAVLDGLTRGEFR